MFEHIDENKAKIIFWCSLYAISDIQIIQSLKSATINFIGNKQNKEFILKLFIENIVLFRDTIITRMKNLNIKISIKIIDSNSEKDEKRRITLKEMSKMNLLNLEKNIAEIKESIDKGEVDEYSINILTTLCGKAIEEINKSFGNQDEEKIKKYEKIMEDVYKLEKIENFNVNEINENGELNKLNEEKAEENKSIDSIDHNKIEINNIDNNNNIIINEIKEENEIINENKEIK